MVHVFLTLTVCPWVGNVSCQPAPVLGVNWFHEVGPWRGAGVRGGGGRCRGRAEDMSPSPGTGRDGLKRGLLGSVWRGLPGSAP